MKHQRKAFELIGIVLFAFVGIWVLKATGLYDAADSGFTKLGLAGGVAYYFAISFWVALHR